MVVYEQNDGASDDIVAHMSGPGGIGTPIVIENTADESAGVDVATLDNGGSSSSISWTAPTR